MITFLFFLPFILVFTLFAVYAERKVSAFMQSRIGPMETGPKGILQTFADILKMLQKENIVPAAADNLLFMIAPIVVFTAIFAGFSVLPLNELWGGPILDVGLFFLLAIVSLDVMGILMAGWGSNNKFSTYGAFRSVAQIVSYEIPLGISVLCVIVLTQTLNIQEIILNQGTNSARDIYLFGLKSTGVKVTEVGGFLTWNIMQNPFLWFVLLIFFISGLAESNRAPFDLPESESEIIGGYHTEYSGFRWGIFMLSEYGMMLLISMLASILFFGGWQTILPNIGNLQLAEWTSGPIWGTFWLLSKSMVFVFIQMWVRWTFPRLRVDQLMTLSWKYLTPASILLLFVSGIWKLLSI